MHGPQNVKSEVGTSMSLRIVSNSPFPHGASIQKKDQHLD